MRQEHDLYLYVLLELTFVDVNRAGTLLVERIIWAVASSNGVQLFRVGMIWVLLVSTTTKAESHRL